MMKSFAREHTYCRLANPHFVVQVCRLRLPVEMNERSFILLPRPPSRQSHLGSPLTSSIDCSREGDSSFVAGGPFRDRDIDRAKGDRERKAFLAKLLVLAPDCVSAFHTDIEYGNNLDRSSGSSQHFYTKCRRRWRAQEFGLYESLLMHLFALHLARTPWAPRHKVAGNRRERTHQSPKDAHIFSLGGACSMASSPNPRHQIRTTLYCPQYPWPCGSQSVSGQDGNAR